MTTAESGQPSALPEAVILDFGGVLYDIDYDAPVRAFAALGVADFAGIYHQDNQSDLFDDLETGGLRRRPFCARCSSIAVRALRCRPSQQLGIPF